MKQMVKQTDGWNQGAGDAISHNVYDGEVKQDEAANIAEEALDKIAVFWKRIWHREAADVEQIYQGWETAMNDTCKEGLTMELRAMAWGNRATAAGTSGWSGSELEDWPRGAWEAAVTMLNDFVEKEETPQVWCEFRQILLWKAGALKRQDAATEVKYLRPIFIGCVVLRTIAWAIAKRSAT